MTVKSKHKITLIISVILIAAVLFFFLRTPEPIDDNRYVEPDRLFDTLEANVLGNGELEVIVDIDHSRLGAEAGSPMPPSHVLIFSDSKLDADIVAQNPVAAVDLPLRVLAYENPETGTAAVITNSYDFVAKRHSLPDDDAVRARYESALAAATEGISKDAIDMFSVDSMADSD